MKLIIKPIDRPIDFDASQIYSLSILDIKTYRLVVESISSHYSKLTDDTSVTLIDKDNEPINIPKYALPIYDSYTFDLSSRPITTALIKDLQNRSTIKDSLLQRIQKDLLDLVGDLDTQSNNKLYYKSEIELSDILKIMGVKLAASDHTTLLDRIYSIIDISRNLLDKKLLIFINHRPLIDSEEFANLMSYISQTSLSVVFIDSLRHELVPGERRLTIDKDFYSYE